MIPVLRKQEDQEFGLSLWFGSSWATEPCLTKEKRGGERRERGEGRRDVGEGTIKGQLCSSE